MRWKYCVQFNHGKVLAKSFDNPTDMWRYADKVKEYCRHKHWDIDSEAQIRRQWFERG